MKKMKKKELNELNARLVAEVTKNAHGDMGYHPINPDTGNYYWVEWDSSNGEITGRLREQTKEPRSNYNGLDLIRLLEIAGKEGKRVEIKFETCGYTGNALRH